MQENANHTHHYCRHPDNWMDCDHRNFHTINRYGSWCTWCRFQLGLFKGAYKSYREAFVLGLAPSCKDLVAAISGMWERA